uniref:Uncharacterized protein n=1 Tax=Octopus bimaculoides TaxID=37653 RepID=A0A0L8IH08_OCTBM
MLLSQEQHEQILEQNAAQHRRRQQINNRLTLSIARQYDIDGLLQVPVDVAHHSCGLMECIERSSLIGACLKKSVIWHKCEVLPLTTNMRVQNCLTNNDTTSQARLAYHSVWLLQVEIPQQFQVNSKEDLINHVYENLEVNFNNAQWLSSRAILTTKNKEVDNLNNHISQKFPDNMITASKITGVNGGCTFSTPCINQQPSDTNLPFTLKRHQFPV